MEKKDHCPLCQSYKISYGKLTGDVRLVPLGKTILSSSPIIAAVCTECGYIIAMKVQYPEKFRK